MKRQQDENILRMKSENEGPRKRGGNKRVSMREREKERERERGRERERWSKRWRHILYIRA